MRVISLYVGINSLYVRIISLYVRINSKNAPHLESAITLGVFVQMFATANCSGGTPKKVSNNILLDPSRKTIFRSTGEIGVSNELH